MVTIKTFNIAMELWGCVLSALIAVYVQQGRKQMTPRSKAFFWIAVCQSFLQLFDAVGFLHEGNPSFLNHHIVFICNFMVFVLGYVLMALFSQYMTSYLEETGKVSRFALNANKVIAVIAIVLVVVSAFNHMYFVIDADSYYVRQDLFWLSQVFGILGLIINGAFWLVYRKRIDFYGKVTLCIYMVLPICALLIQIFIYGLALLNFANTISLIIIFIFVQMNLVKQEKILANRLSQQSVELADSRTMLLKTRMDLMRSQIQPHFIYNTLSTISELCMTQPQKAMEVTQEFSQYLRGNFDEMDNRLTIRLSREIEHVKHYTSIEHVRFPDMEIYYNLQSDEFFLPALSIQPLVENAIKHGLMGLERGGVVIISTYELKDAYCVSVEDNGVGFDPDAPFSQRGRKHLGIANIRERLKIMCDGTLTIDSAPGCGTKAVISIPKGDLE